MFCLLCFLQVAIRCKVEPSMEEQRLRRRQCWNQITRNGRPWCRSLPAALNLLRPKNHTDPLNNDFGVDRGGEGWGGPPSHHINNIRRRRRWRRRRQLRRLFCSCCCCVCVITPKCNKRAVRCGAEKAHHSDNNKLHFSYKERKRLKIIHTFFFFFFFFFPCSPYSLLGRLLHFEREGAHPAAAAASSRQQGNYFLGGRYTNREDK